MTTLQEGISAYKIISGAENKSAKTIERVVSSARYLKNFLGEDPELESITRRDVQRWIAAMKQRGKWADHPTTRPRPEQLCAATISTYVRSIQLLLRTIHREELIPPHPVMAMKPPKEPTKVVQALSPAQFKEVFKAAERGVNPRRDRAILLLFLDTGIRLSELSGLKVQDLDLEGRQAKVFGKGQKERIVPLGATAAKAILGYTMRERPEPRGSDAVFLDKEGLPMTSHGVQQLFRRLKDRSGVSKLHPHQMRHSYALLYLRNGENPFLLQRTLGHTSLAMTRRYSDLENTDLIEAHKRYSPADRLRV